jgi:hypothetical protein
MAIVSSRTNRMVFSGAAAVVAAVAGGWWQWTADEPPSDSERIAALEGVAAVEHDSVQYVITLDPDVTQEQISDLLTEAEGVLKTSDDPSAYPDTFLSTELGEYYVDITADADQTAEVIASTEADPDLAGANIDFAENGLTQFTFRGSDTGLADARRLVSAYERAGVTDLTPMGGRLEFSTIERSRNAEGPMIELDTSRTDVALHRLDLLTQTLQSSGAELLEADLGTGDQEIDVAVSSQAKVEPTARVFTAAYGERHLILTIDSGAPLPED